ncbi:hypothetical protein [Streptomyces hirsutus]|uniref:hypothetical protein n=1 Tax=Streptomyces hirsutus TaxID=35620 RepID=UPI003316EA09
MSTTTVAPSPVHTLAAQVAALLPARAGTPWTVEPYAPWWTARHPGVRLVQGKRALILVRNGHAWTTQLGWQLPDREPYGPDVTLNTTAPAAVAREILRLVLPVLDDEAAGRAAAGGPRVMGRLELLNEIGHTLRLQGVATYNRAGLLADTSTLAWTAPSGVRYSVTLHGTNPVGHVQIDGPVRAVEKAVTCFLPAVPSGRPQAPAGVRGRLQRRMAAVLARHTTVEQTEQGGLAFATGPGPGPYGYAAPARDAQARAHDTTPASVDVHGVGVDFLISLAPQLCR